jgi:uncharacterized protein YqjF (DUF2071 family)
MGVLLINSSDVPEIQGILDTICAHFPMSVDVVHYSQLQRVKIDTYDGVTISPTMSYQADQHRKVTGKSLMQVR